MKLRRALFWDKVFATLSWGIVFFLIWATIGLWISPPTGAGPVAGAVGILASQIFYSILYGAEAVLLAFSKIYQKKNMRKKVLLTIYLTGMFTFLLSLTVIGFHWKIIDNLAFSVLAGACWLYWKAKTEYIDPKFFMSVTVPMRDNIRPPDDK